MYMYVTFLILLHVSTCHLRNRSLVVSIPTLLLSRMAVSAFAWTYSATCGASMPGGTLDTLVFSKRPARWRTTWKSPRSHLV